jgi:hypothetical protein
LGDWGIGRLEVGGLGNGYYRFLITNYQLTNYQLPINQLPITSLSSLELYQEVADFVSLPV